MKGLIIFAIISCSSYLYADNIQNYFIGKHSVNYNLYKEVLLTAKKSENSIFSHKDIMALIGIESSWNIAAKNKNCYGLTQLNTKYWGKHIRAQDQVEVTFKVLNEYYSELKNKNNTIIAYNCGLNNFKRGKCGKKYLQKFNRELKEIEENES